MIKWCLFLNTHSTRKLNLFELVFFCLQSNNYMLLTVFQIRLEPSYKGSLKGDKAEDVQWMAYEHFKAHTFTIYTEIKPKNSDIYLVLGTLNNFGGKYTSSFF